MCTLISVVKCICAPDLQYWLKFPFEPKMLNLVELYPYINDIFHILVLQEY